MKQPLKVKTYRAEIYCGLRPGYDDIKLPADITAAQSVCRDYCSEVKLCVTVTPTKFFYVGGEEPGFVVGAINYPRFPSKPEDIKLKMIELAKRLKKQLSQIRVSIVCDDETIMLGDKE